jgi:hypothetical protein
MSYPHPESPPPPRLQIKLGQEKKLTTGKKLLIYDKSDIQPVLKFMKFLRNFTLKRSDPFQDPNSTNIKKDPDKDPQLKQYQKGE